VTLEIDPAPPYWDGKQWHRQKACDCERFVHVNVASSVSKMLGVPFGTAMDWDCRILMTVSRALNALTWATQGVDITHCCCCADHCQRSVPNSPAGPKRVSAAHHDTQR
jgi:hypothetical protein